MPLPIPFQDLTIRVHHPIDTCLSKGAESPETSLTAVPWTLSGATETSLTSNSHGFPNLHYLELRREQNQAFADGCLQQGNQEIILLNPSKAQEFFQHGLDLVPDHIPILLAQVRLWMQLLATLHSANTVSVTTIRAQITHILELDPQNQDAQQLSKQLLSHSTANKTSKLALTATTTTHKQPARTRPTPGFTLKHESSSAYQDALMERNILLADDVSLIPTMEGDPDAEDQDVAPSRRSKDKKKKKRRRRYDTSSSEDSSSRYSSDSSDDRRERRRRYRRKRRHKRKHHRRDRGEDDGGLRGESDRDTSSKNHQEAQDQSPRQNDAATTENKTEKEDDSDMSNKESRKHRHRRRSSHKKRKREKRRRRDDSSSTSND